MKKIIFYFCLLSIMVIGISGCVGSQVDLKVGSTFDKTTMKVKENQSTFKLGDPIYYSMTSKSENKDLKEVKVIVTKSDSKQPILTETIPAIKGKIDRPINPIAVEAKGKYSVEVLNGKDQMKKVDFEVK